jgi:hypothetical protein
MEEETGGGGIKLAILERGMEAVVQLSMRII